MPEQRLSAILSNAYYATLWRYASACSFGSGYTYPLLFDTDLPEGTAAMNETNSDSYINMAKLLGFGGLVPFAGCAVLMYSGSPSASIVALFANAVYGAAILSFVGAVHWGLTMREDRSPYWYVWSITPAILGWLAIVLLDIKISLLALAIAFTLAWSVDRQASLRGLIPAWYMQMRHILTAGATISLLATAFAPPVG